MIEKRNEMTERGANRRKVIETNAAIFKKVKDKLSLGQEIEARVIKIDKEERRIGLSIKALEEDFNEADLKAAGEEVSAALKPGEALGDMSQLIGNSLDNLDVVKNS